MIRGEIWTSDFQLSGLTLYQLSVRFNDRAKRTFQNPFFFSSLIATACLILCRYVSSSLDMVRRAGRLWCSLGHFTLHLSNSMSSSNGVSMCSSKFLWEMKSKLLLLSCSSHHRMLYLWTLVILEPLILYCWQCSLKAMLVECLERASIYILKHDHKVYCDANYG